MDRSDHQRPRVWAQVFYKPVLALVLVLQLARTLISQGFYWPGRILRALRAWRLFARAGQVANEWMAANIPEHTCPPDQRRRLLRYARNTLGLVAIQPTSQRGGWDWPRRECAIGTAYGLCIPLYDDCFDEVDLEAARAFEEAWQDSLSGPVWRPELAPDGMSDVPGLLRLVSVALFSEIEADNQARFTELLREMTAAQLESLEEHVSGTPPDRLRAISTRKGVASHHLLLAGLGELEAHRCPALTAAATWAQWMDDYDDLESDKAQGSWTYVAHMEAQGGALGFIEDELRTALRLLEERYGASGRLFADVLALNFVVKVAHRRTQDMAQRWGAVSAMPRFFWKGSNPEDSGARIEPEMPVSAS